MTQEEIDAWVEREIKKLSPEAKRRAVEVLATFLRPDFQASQSAANQGYEVVDHFVDATENTGQQGGRRRTATTHISVKQLAERWDCPLSSIYRQVETLKLPALRIGQGIRIPLAAVERFEAENTTGLNPTRA